MKKRGRRGEGRTGRRSGEEREAERKVGRREAEKREEGKGTEEGELGGRAGSEEPAPQETLYLLESTEASRGEPTRADFFRPPSTARAQRPFASGRVRRVRVTAARPDRPRQ